MRSLRSSAESASTFRGTAGSMKKSEVVGFDPKSLEKRLFDHWVGEQIERLIKYAEDKVVQIGVRINSYHRAHHMDRTGNLLNSLCWGVAYNNKLYKYGFFRDGAEKGESFMHERYADYMYAFPVHGRALAEQFIKSSGKMTGANRFRVFFAILAPYWGYWEKGFKMKYKGGSTFMQFSVMAEIYDQVTSELSPAEVKFSVTKDISYSKPYAMYRDKRGRSVYGGSLVSAWRSRVDSPQNKRRK